MNYIQKYVMAVVVSSGLISVMDTSCAARARQECEAQKRKDAERCARQLA